MGLSCFKSWKHDSTGPKGNRDVLASPGSYFFLSNSAGQGDEWLKSLNKGVWIPFTGVFGQSLEETVVYERRYGVRVVPLVVEQCVNFIRERGMQEVGLFRLPGRASLVKELQEAFDAGERPSFDGNTDVHTVASLLKLYLRQLPEPLVPYSCYQDFLLCGQELLTDRSLGLGELRDLLCELPVANFNLLNFICQFLNEVQSFSSCNKMSVQNLATVFGPNLLRAKAEDPQSIMGGAALVQVLMLELIREHESLFTKVPPSISACLPRGLHASPSTPRQAHLHPSPYLRQLSLPLITERSGEPGQSTRNPSCMNSAAAKSDLSCGQKKHLGHRYTSSHPENCFYPQPSSSQPVKHHTSQANILYKRQPADQKPSPGSTSSLHLRDPLPDSPKPKLKGWEKPWPFLGEEGSDYWSCGVVDKQGAVPETVSRGSSEAQEDSTLSTYDNLHSMSPLQIKEDVSGPDPEATDSGDHVGTPEEQDRQEAGQKRDSSSSWSSCEVLPLDGSDDAAAAVHGDMSPKRWERLHSSQVENEEDSHRDEHEDKTNDDDEDEEDDNVYYPNSPASCSVPSNSPLSTGSSEVFLPSSPPDLQGSEAPSQPRDAHSLLAELWQQMAQQRAEYQARIQRLERCNDVLKHQVAVLRVSLEQQKRSQSVAEIKIRNIERDKANADLRNSTLQREMELFFQMYGESQRREGGGRGGGSL